MVLKMTNKFSDKLSELREELIILGKEIHEYSEVQFKEVRSAAALEDYLESHGFNVTRGLGSLPTAFKAQYGEGSPCIAFLCEYDALEQIGHACGHNLIAMVGAGAGVLLKEVIDEFDGSIVVLGTPAEEGGGGKIIMLEEGAFEGVEYVMMAHPASIRNLVLRGARATMNFDITFHGRSSHSSAPEFGINALNALIGLFNGIHQYQVSFPMNSNLNGIITEGGVVTNAIPDRASASFSMRAMTMEDNHTMREIIEKVIAGIETMTGATAEYKFTEGYGERYPNKTMELYVKELMEEQGEVVEIAAPMGKYGASDIGNISMVIPSIHSYFAISKEQVSAHHKSYTIACNTEYAYEKALIMLQSLARLGERILKDPEFRDNINNEFKTEVFDKLKKVK